METKYNYRYSVKTSDLWQASMYYAYSSYMGVVNVVCIIAAITLIISRWSVSSDFLRTVMVLFLLLFTVIQPLAILSRARSSLKGSPHKLELTFSQAGITIASEGRKEDKKWKDVKGIVLKPTIMIIYTEDGAGYILRNSVLKETRRPLYDFVREMLDKNKKGQA